MPSSERASENRRMNKPVMEKRRRARINDCLGQLKSLVLEGMKKDPARHSKLEKADILDMAVKHMRSLNARSGGTTARFQEGYADCAREVASYLNDRDELDLELKQRLMVHLASAYRPLTTIAPASTPAAAAAGPTAASVGVLNSLQLVPTLLPSGEVGYIIQQRPAAGLTQPPSDAGGPLSVGAQPASVGSPSPVPSSHTEHAWDPAEPSSPASPSSSVGSSGSSVGSSDSAPPDSPRPLDLVAHSRSLDDACWRPW